MLNSLTIHPRGRRGAVRRRCPIPERSFVVHFSLHTERHLVITEVTTVHTLKRHHVDPGTLVDSHWRITISGSKNCQLVWIDNFILLALLIIILSSEKRNGREISGSFHLHLKAPPSHRTAGKAVLLPDTQKCFLPGMGSGTLEMTVCPVIEAHSSVSATAEKT